MCESSGEAECRLCDVQLPLDDDDDVAVMAAAGGGVDTSCYAQYDGKAKLAPCDYDDDKAPASAQADDKLASLQPGIEPPPPPPPPSASAVSELRVVNEICYDYDTHM